jgi:DNA-binding GntR family transcriptional regulator
VSKSPFIRRQIEQVSTTERVTAQIRWAVLTGRMHPGQEFSLREIARTLDVSFIPVREALHILEAEGLLHTRRGRSALVAPLDPAEINSICQLRRRIEPDLAHSACKLITSDALTELESSIDPADDGPNGLDEAYTAHQHLLHTLLRPAATPWEIRVLHVLWRATERYLRASSRLINLAYSQDHPLYVNQRALIDGFRTQDPERSRAAMLHHVYWNEQAANFGLAAVS